MKPKAAYEWLRKEQIQTAYLGALGNLAAWDQRTFLPPKGHGYRAEQLATLALIMHERSTNPRIGECLEILESSDMVADKLSTEAINVREWRRENDRLTRIPSSLAENLARATAEGETAWETAREKNAWEKFAPYLKRIVKLTKEKADAIGYESEPYDALVEDYEMGETTESLLKLFGQLKRPLVELVARISKSDVQPNETILHRSYPLEAQEEFSYIVATRLGYAFNAGRLDESAHPFTIGIAPGDVRVTTRYNESYLPSALLGTIHEAGHGMYEQGLLEDHFGTPRGQTVSLGMHESQSRLYENFVGRSEPFWRWAFPIARKRFSSLSDVDFDEFLLALNAVKPSLIRVEADEVTYNLHIILRFEIEVALLRGDLSVSDLPEAWNEKMAAMFNLVPKTDADGVMQDVHWPAGLFGYFPTYSLGNLYAAQLFRTIQQKIPSLDADFESGDFSKLLEWLRKWVHEPGSSYSPKELISRATGEPPNAKYLIDYLEEKFGSLYRL